MFPFPGLYVIFSNKVLLIALLVSGILLPFTIFLYDESWFNNQVSQRNLMLIMLSIFSYSGMSILLQNGQFAYTRYADWVNLSAVIIVVGSVIKVMHWPGADALLFAGLLSVSIIYTLYFFLKKKERTLLSILKLVFAYAWMQWRWISIFNWGFADELQLASEGLLILILVLYISKNYKELIKS